MVLVWGVKAKRGFDAPVYDGHLSILRPHFLNEHIPNKVSFSPLVALKCNGFAAHTQASTFKVNGGF